MKRTGTAKKVEGNMMMIVVDVESSPLYTVVHAIVKPPFYYPHD
jgi:hypothetical protein